MIFLPEVLWTALCPLAPKSVSPVGREDVRPPSTYVGPTVQRWLSVWYSPWIQRVDMRGNWHYKPPASEHRRGRKEVVYRLMLSDSCCEYFERDNDTAERSVWKESPEINHIKEDCLLWSCWRNITPGNEYKDHSENCQDNWTGMYLEEVVRAVENRNNWTVILNETDNFLELNYSLRPEPNVVSEVALHI